MFLFPANKEHNSQTVRLEPCGGTEKSVVFLGEALTLLGHEVRHIWDIGTPFDSAWPDVVVTQEGQLFDAFPNARKVFWSHHFADQPITLRSAAFIRIHEAQVVTLSKCHHDDLRDVLRLESEIIRHGVWHEELATGVTKEPFRLIYASAPFRGLERVPELFRQIKAVEPRATLAVCSSMKMYGTPEEDAKYQALFDELKAMDGVEVLGSLNQAQLYEQYALADVFFYPCIWRETYCLAMDEAMAHNCPPIIPSDIGALSERVKLSTRNVDLMSLSVLTDWKFRAFNEDLYGGKWRQGDIRYEVKSWLDIGKQWECLLQC